MNPLILASEDLDFMIHGVFSYTLFGQELWITTTHVCLLLVILVILTFCIFANRAIKNADPYKEPGAFQNIVELIVEMLDNMITGVMGKSAPKFLNYISTIFIFILISNISGIFGLRAPTADYGVTLPLGLISFGLIFFNKIKHQKVSGFIKGLCEPWPFWHQLILSVTSPFRFHYHFVFLLMYYRELLCWHLYTDFFRYSLKSEYLPCFMHILIFSREQFRHMYSVC